jgi:choline monooxygenase
MHRALPASAYLDQAVAAGETRDVFAPAWQLLAHVSQLASPGDHVVVEMAPALPVIVLRDAAGELRAFHNVCRHRAGPLAACDGHDARFLRCRYHGWRYGLDGVLQSAPEMDRVPGFDPATIRLPALAVRVWRGLVFACADPTRALDLDASLADLETRLISAGHASDVFEGWGTHQRVHYSMACNWKLYVENYLEGYHVPHVHPALNRMLDYRRYRTDCGTGHVLQSSPIDGGDGPYGQGEALYDWLWPNTMLNLLPGRLQANRVLPRGVDRCEVVFDTWYAPGTTGAGGDAAFSELVQAEDIGICEDVQRGLASGSYTPGPLQPARESGLVHFHALLATAIHNARGGPC